MVQRWGPRFDMEGDMERALLHWTRENGCISFSCINASSSSISYYCIFKGRSFRWNFIIRCKEGACMAM